MSIEDKITRKETEFFEKEVRDAKFLILTPESFHELSNELGYDYKDSVGELTSYNGLVVCVTTNENANYIEVV